MAKATKRHFTVEAHINLLCTATVVAESVAQAAELAGNLELSDFIDVKGEHNDSRLSVNGVYSTVYPIPQ